MAIPEKNTFLCPHCNVLSLHALNGSAKDYQDTIYLKGTSGKRHKVTVAMQHRIYRCVNCGKDTYFLFKGEGRAFADTGAIPGLPEIGALPQVVGTSPPAKIHQHPISTPTVDPSVNEDVKRAAVEAEKCLSVNAFNACGVMTRRAMHCLCDDKDAKGKDLFEKLKYLRDNNLITPDLWEWAEELRIVGRSGAHPEWEEVSKDDAEYALKFLREIIRYVYINPAERAVRWLKETKKKKK